MAIKIGHYYITRNNPREILWLLARKQDRIDEAKEKLKSISLYGLRSRKTLISALINDVLDILEGYDDYYDQNRTVTK